MTNRPPARDRPGALERRRGSQYRGSRVMPGEGRDLSSRRTQDVVRDLEIGQPINSEECSETADGVDDFRVATEQHLFHLDHRLLGIAPGTVRVLFGWKVGFEDRFQHVARESE